MDEAERSLNSYVLELLHEMADMQNRLVMFGANKVGDKAGFVAHWWNLRNSIYSARQHFQMGIDVGRA